MGLNLEYLDDQTPLDENEMEGLRIGFIATRGELDEYEQQNIEIAMQWILGRSFSSEDILAEDFIRNIHKRMYKEVWTWAGNFRTTNKNLGADYWLIPIQLKQLLDDTLYWYGHEIYSPDEIAIRFKHRLVSIHCFSNGNGRHSRLMADIIIEKIYNMPVFTWGAANLARQGDARNVYMQALKAADGGDYNSLIAFARS